MPTHRSLNKLEFKAHMSIHNSTVVPDEELHESTAFTRDRLGKKHLLVDETGTPRISDLRKKTAAALIALALAGAVPSFAAEGSDRVFVKTKGPNTQISSTDPEVSSVESWMNASEEKPVLYKDGNTAVGFNNDGDPNVSTRF